MDVLPAEEIEELILVFNDFEDAAINDYFDNFGLSYTSSLRNMGSSFIYILISILALPLIKVFKALLTILPCKMVKFN